ncbi:hypothetical protein EU508_00535 [Pseudoalteromonas fuliginea]|uniref:Uncharacterized protein n=1 Tax=Pseudoalteromonas fuliginea TaxID=1872678 RepID=A0AB73BLT8_9GAMM|nr:hypothetical protein [Pseudoalteromonas fuliginea]KAA1165773.1 hypothetical protein EU508_00535 [Pseudoalteromonas fuliginea]
MQLKDLDHSDFQQNDEKLPKIACACCRKSEQSSKAMAPSEWLYAANFVGWRKVITDGTTLSPVCPHCVDEMDAVAEAQTA